MKVFETKTTKVDRARQVLRGLEDSCDEVTDRGRGTWALSLRNGRSIRADAQLDGDWLLLDARLSRPTKNTAAFADRLFRMLGWNADLPSGVKFALGAEGHLRVRADITIPAHSDTRRRVQQACHGMQAAAYWYRSRKAPKAWNEPLISVGPEVAEEMVDLRSLCEEAGWDHSERSDGSLSIALEAEHWRHAVATRDARGVRISVSLGNSTGVSATCRRATGILLMHANREVRMVRAVAENVAPALCTSLEVLLGWPPTAVELEHALGALSVACRLCALEVDALLDETVAKGYLAAQGRSLRPYRQRRV
jgi:hypothetical protein